MPFIGELPMSKLIKIILSLKIIYNLLILIVFYIPECGEAYEMLKSKIEENGGLVVE